MENEKSVLYTVVLGVCMIICLLLVGKMLLHKPTPVYAPPSMQMEQAMEPSEHEMDPIAYLSQEDLSDILRDHLPVSFPADDVSITIERDGTVSAEGMLQKNKLSQLVEKGSTMRSALLLMPSEFAMRAVFDADHSGGQLVLRPKTISVGGFEVSAEIIEPLITDVLNTAVNDVLEARYPGFTGIDIVDGGIELNR